MINVVGPIREIPADAPGLLALIQVLPQVFLMPAMNVESARNHRVGAIKSRFLMFLKKAVNAIITPKPINVSVRSSRGSREARASDTLNVRDPLLYDGISDTQIGRSCR